MATAVEILEDESAAPITPTGRCGRVALKEEFDDITVESITWSDVLGRIFRGGVFVRPSLLKRLFPGPSNTAG